jgi:TPR repeat protein
VGSGTAKGTAVARFVSSLRPAYWRTHSPRAHENTTAVSRERSTNAAAHALAGIPFPLPFPAERNSTFLIAVANGSSFKYAAPVLAVPPRPAPAQAEKPVAPSVPEDAGQTALAQARELLQKDADPEQQAKAAQLLWQAVEKGNVPAEVELANLYLLGQGVAKSCGQARVLLSAAQLRKSTTAGKKLDDFPQYGCE